MWVVYTLQTSILAIAPDVHGTERRTANARTTNEELKHINLLVTLDARFVVSNSAGDDGI
jgi:hypothetical protein